MRESSACVYIKAKGNGYEVWAEDYVKGEMVEVADCRILLTDKECMVDSITVYPGYRNRGHARKIINTLKEKFGKRIVPVGVLPSAREFWDKMTPGWR